MERPVRIGDKLRAAFGAFWFFSLANIHNNASGPVAKSITPANVASVQIFQNLTDIVTVLACDLHAF
jgi:hypothetical protein